jgi:hypothetical protein
LHPSAPSRGPMSQRGTYIAALTPASRPSRTRMGAQNTAYSTSLSPRGAQDRAEHSPHTGVGSRAARPSSGTSPPFDLPVAGTWSCSSSVSSRFPSPDAGHAAAWHGWPRSAKALRGRGSVQDISLRTSKRSKRDCVIPTLRLQPQLCRASVVVVSTDLGLACFASHRPSSHPLDLPGVTFVNVLCY